MPFILMSFSKFLSSSSRFFYISCLIFKLASFNSYFSLSICYSDIYFVASSPSARSTIADMSSFLFLNSETWAWSWDSSSSIILRYLVSSSVSWVLSLYLACITWHSFIKISRSVSALHNLWLTWSSFPANSPKNWLQSYLPKSE